MRTILLAAAFVATELLALHVGAQTPQIGLPDVSVTAPITTARPQRDSMISNWRNEEDGDQRSGVSGSQSGNSARQEFRRRDADFRWRFFYRVCRGKSALHCDGAARAALAWRPQLGHARQRLPDGCATGIDTGHRNDNQPAADPGV
jgi:hypothetical protein